MGYFWTRITLFGLIWVKKTVFKNLTHPSVVISSDIDPLEERIELRVVDILAQIWQILTQIGQILANFFGDSSA